MNDLKILSREYHKDIEKMGISSLAFVDVVDRVNVKAKFFPTMADISDAYSGLQEENYVTYDQKQIELGHPEGKSKAYGLKSIDNIKEMLAGRLSMDEVLLTEIGQSQLTELIIA